MSFSNTSSPSQARRDVQAISDIEEAALRARSWGERLGDHVARAAGRMWFIVLHVVWFSGRVVANSGRISYLRPFDRFPYPFLTFAVSLEAIFPSLFIVMSQNRATKKADHRAHLDLQINLLAENEMTVMLNLLQAFCAFHGLVEASDSAIEDLKAQTRPEHVLQNVKNSLPTENA